MEKNSVLQIDIVGNRYNVEPDQENLIPIDELLDIIQIGRLVVSFDDDWERFGYYDLINKSLYRIPDNLKEAPENVIGFSIPSSRDLAEKLHNTLVIYAKVVPLNETNFMQEVEERNLDAVEHQVKIDSDKSKAASQIERLGLDKKDKNVKKLHQRKPKKKRGKHL